VNIALDATYSLGRHLSGVGIYSRELLRALAALRPEVRFRFCYRPHRWLRAWGEPLPANARRTWLSAHAPRDARLFHGLNQRLPESDGVPQVVTFHDLFVMTGNYSTPEFRARFSQQAREAAGRTARVIAVSSFTQQQVEELLEFPAERIDVVPHGVHLPPELPPVPREKIVLNVGVIQTRKNIARLVRAFRAMPAGWRLVIAGGTGYGAEQAMAEIERSPRRSDILLTGYLADEDLQSYYRRASIFAFPSLDEGFGIPVLEAMAYGVPLLSSRRPSLEEIATGAALLVDPKKEEEIAAALVRLATDVDFAQTLVAEGKRRANLYSWRRAAELTWAVYEKVWRESR
jgi:glycosyltransferase involved in cell wall biosynthesis